MQRHWQILGVAALLLYACGPLGCGPVGPFPGGKLRGETAPQPDDWSFSDDYKNIEVETDPQDPYSVTVWCTSHEGRLYIAAARGAESTWAANLLEDPRSRVRIDGKLYDQRAVRVTERAEADEVLDMYVAKYDFDLPTEEERAGAILFRMEPPSAE